MNTFTLWAEHGSGSPYTLQMLYLSMPMLAVEDLQALAGLRLPQLSSLKLAESKSSRITGPAADGSSYLQLIARAPWFLKLHTLELSLLTHAPPGDLSGLSAPLLYSLHLTQRSAEPSALSALASLAIPHLSGLRVTLDGTPGSATALAQLLAAPAAVITDLSVSCDDDASALAAALSQAQLPALRELNLFLHDADNTVFASIAAADYTTQLRSLLVTWRNGPLCAVSALAPGRFDRLQDLDLAWGAAPHDSALLAVTTAPWFANLGRVSFQSLACQALTAATVDRLCSDSPAFARLHAAGAVHVLDL